MEHTSQGGWLLATGLYLGAGVVGVLVARRFGLSAILGYLLAGIAIGPYGLDLVGDTEAILHFAEFGVVLMLFTIGLELEPPKLWSMRRPIFGWGSLQVLGCAAALGAAAWLLGWRWEAAVVAGLGLALSSTAVALGVLQERNLLPTSGGQAAFAILLFQDVAAIPILAAIPLLAHVKGAGSPWLEAAKALAVIAAIVLIGRLLLREVLRRIARSRTPELFTAAALGLVVGIACLMQVAGLSMALGAFLGGVLLAESEYRRELETDVEPFKGLLLGLFFMAVGMGIDFAVLSRRAGLVALLLVGFLAIKALLLGWLARCTKVAPAERALFTLLLAQGGEFAFVVFQQAEGVGVLDAELGAVLTGSVALSMCLTPLLLLALDRFGTPAGRRAGTMAELSEPQAAPVIIAGFGRYGQVVGRLLYANGIDATVLDHDAEQIEAVRRFGMTVHYGDATRLDLLRTAGATTARVLVVAIDDIEQSLRLVDVARTEFPHLTLVARARNVQHYYALRDRGVTLVERETLDAALLSGRSVMELLGWQPYAARQLAMRFRRHSVQQLERLWPHHRDERALISMTRRGREQLEELFAQERAERRQRFERHWGEGQQQGDTSAPPP